MSGHRRSGSRRPWEAGPALGLTLAFAMALAAQLSSGSRALPLAWAATAFVGALAVLAWALALVSIVRRTRRDQSLGQLQALTPDEFEEWVAARWRERGYSVRVAGGWGDHGADLIAEREGERVIVQCKKYRAWKVGEPALRDLYGSMLDFGAQRACIVSTGPVSAAARAWARGKPIEIWDGACVARLAEGTAPPSGQSMGRGAAPEEACPRCGRALVMRRNRTTGEAFLGCEGFPRCRYTRPLLG